MLGIPLRARHLGRYKELLRLYYKYARGRTDESADALADDLERLGPTFIKLGQLLSTRPDLVPPAYIDALARLQDHVEPFPYEEAAATVEEDLGVRLETLFPEFSVEPVAAASLAQTHRARLRDGRPVAVKIQRPGARRKFLDDLAALGEAAAFVDARTEIGRRHEFGLAVEELRRNLLRELDYDTEARSLRRLRENLTEFPDIVVPLPHEDYSGSRVLTMDWVDGVNIAALSPLRATELEGARLADQLFRAYLKQILVDGFMHADPHPGNVLVTDDGKVALIDLGMTAHLPPLLQEDLLELLMAIVDGRAETAADIAIKAGHRREGFREDSFRREVSRLVLQHKGAKLADLDTGRVILEISRASSESGLRLPSEMTMLGKTLLNLDKAVWALDPGYDPNEAIRRETGNLVTERMRRSVSQGSLLTGLLELRKFAEKLPDRLGRLLDVVGDNRIEVKVKAFDEKRLIDGLQKIANRVALGVVLGSLIIGAALLMRVETRFTLFGYPGLAIVLFLAAAAGGLGLILDILYYDEQPPRRPRFR